MMNSNDLIECKNASVCLSQTSEDDLAQNGK